MSNAGLGGGVGTNGSQIQLGGKPRPSTAAPGQAAPTDAPSEDRRRVVLGPGLYAGDAPFSVDPDDPHSLDSAVAWHYGYAAPVRADFPDTPEGGRQFEDAWAEVNKQTLYELEENPDNPSIVSSEDGSSFIAYSMSEWDDDTDPPDTEYGVDDLYEAVLHDPHGLGVSARAILELD